MNFFKEDGVLSGLRLEDPIGRRRVFSHVGEYTSTPRHRIPVHEHECWEFLFQAEGRTSWKQKNQVCDLSPGDLLVCPPRLPHALPHALARVPAGDFRISFFGCSPGLVCRELKIDSLFAGNRLTVLAGARRIVPALRALLEEAFTRQHNRRLGALLALQRVLLEIERLASRNEPIPNHPHHPAINKLQSLILEDPGQRWQLADVARVAGYAPNYIATLFRQETGQTLHGYIMRTRLESARSQLLSSDLTVTQIALQCGFCSSQHFSHAFREYFGRSPNSIRA